MEEIKWKTDKKVPAELDKYLAQLTKSGYLTPEASGTTFEFVNELKSEMRVEEVPQTAALGASPLSKQQDLFRQTNPAEHAGESEWQDGHIKGYDPIFGHDTSINGEDMRGIEKSFLDETEKYFTENSFIIDAEQQTDLSCGLMSPVKMRKIADSFLKADTDNKGYIPVDRLRECLKDAEISANEECLTKIEKTRAGESKTVDWATYFFLCQSVCKPYKKGEGIRI